MNLYQFENDNENSITSNPLSSYNELIGFKEKVLISQFNKTISFQVNDNEDTTSEQFFDVDDELEEVARETVADREVLADEGADGDNHESSALFDQTVDTELMSNL